MKKALGVGNSSFASLIKAQNYYVDKTAFIKEIVNPPSAEAEGLYKQALID